MTLEQLAAKGIEADVVHLRRVGPFLMSRREFRSAGYKPDPRGGITHVTITTPWGLFASHAFCGPEDNFDRRVGRELALERAYHKALRNHPEALMRRSARQSQQHIWASELELAEANRSLL